MTEAIYIKWKEYYNSCFGPFAFVHQLLHRHKTSKSLLKLSRYREVMDIVF